MGGVKRDMMQHQDALQNAIDIAIEAGVLELCEHCNTTVYQISDDVEGAYQFADERFDDLQYEGMFESKGEMHALIKEAVETNPGEECFHCKERLFGDD